LKTDSEYPRDAKVTLFTLANPGSSFRFDTHWSAPPVSTLARSEGPGAQQAEGPPIVVPIYHKGMASVMPQHNLLQQHDGAWAFNKKVLSPIPRTGTVIIMRFVQPIPVDDLVRDYEDAHGPLFKVSSAPMTEAAAAHRMPARSKISKVFSRLKVL